MSSSPSSIRKHALSCAAVVTGIVLSFAPVAFAQSSSSADYAAQVTPSDLQFRTQYQNQYPSGGGGYHQYKGGDSTFSHLAFEGGVGFAVPVSGNNDVNTTGYSFLVGGGHNLNHHLGAMIEYRFDDLGVKNSILEQIAAADPTDTQNGLNANTHAWSFTLDPVYNIKTKGHFGGYVTGGAGFSRMLTSFSVPVFEGYYYDYFYGYVPEYGNSTLSHYSSNQAIVDGGAGLTWKPNRDQHGAIFADVRYEWMDSPGSSTQTIPVTFGYRW